MLLATNGCSSTAINHNTTIAIVTTMLTRITASTTLVLALSLLVRKADTRIGAHAGRDIRTANNTRTDTTNVPLAMALVRMVMARAAGLAARRACHSGLGTGLGTGRSLLGTGRVKAGLDWPKAICFAPAVSARSLRVLAGSSRATVSGADGAGRALAARIMTTVCELRESLGDHGYSLESEALQTHACIR